MNPRRRSWKSGETRLAGEQFALEAGLVLYDISAKPSPADVVDAIASNRMPAALKAYLVDERTKDLAAGSDRHRNTDMEMWIRSATSGDPEAPDAVDVEVAAMTVVPKADLSYWDTRRYVVVWESDQWRLRDVKLSSPGPDSTTALTEAQRRHYLTGTGWRRIAPAA